MIREKNKVYIGSYPDGYLSSEMMSVVYDYLAHHEVYENIKVKPRKIKDNYLLELEINEHSKQIIYDLKEVDKIKLYKRTHTWDEIYKMTSNKVRSS